MQPDSSEDPSSFPSGKGNRVNEIGTTVADRVEAIVHDVGQTLAAGSVAVVNDVKEIDAAVSGLDGATGASAGDHPPFEPDLASEHQAKLLEE